MDMSSLKYPFGKYHLARDYSEEAINGWIQTIEDFPKKITELTKNLSQEELNFTYRPDGWTIKQVVHHCADSHLNSYIRFKWTLTEDSPTIKAYFEDRWAELPDSQNDNISASLELISGLHSRWTNLLKNLSDQQLERSFTHPETGKQISLKKNISLYAWHCEHHLAHIAQALKHQGHFELT